MRYANLINHSLVLTDQPSKTYDQRVDSYFQKIVKQLLCFDQVADNDQEGVIAEALLVLKMRDPAFETLFHNAFEQYIQNERHLGKWQKMRHDYGYYVDAETKRRNKENPYYTKEPETVDSWYKLPDLTKQKFNRPWQYDSLNRDAQNLAGQIYEIGKHFPEQKDKDLFRVKVNSILVPERIIFALNSSDSFSDFTETDISTINVKLSLDAFKQAHIFLNRSIDSLHKLSWFDGTNKLTLAQTINGAALLLARLEQRIVEMERKFILYWDYGPEND